MLCPSRWWTVIPVIPQALLPPLPHIPPPVCFAWALLLVGSCVGSEATAWPTTLRLARQYRLPSPTVPHTVTYSRWLCMCARAHVRACLRLRVPPPPPSPHPLSLSLSVFHFPFLFAPNTRSQDLCTAEHAVGAGAVTPGQAAAQGRHCDPGDVFLTLELF